jgi:O-antigen/teichoic acid export membrane protein
LLPAVSRLHSLDQGDEARRLYVQASRYISMLGGLLMAYLAAFAGAVIVFWLGTAEEYRVAAFILAVFTPAFHMHVVTGPASALYRGVGEPVHELVYPLTQLVLVALGVGVGFATVGRTIEVIAVAVAGSMLVSAAVYEAYTNRRLGVPQGEYFRRVWVPGLLPYGLGGALAAVLQPWAGSALAGRWQALAFLAGAGVIYGLLTSVVLYRVVCDAEERQRARRQGLQAVGRVVPRRWLPAVDPAGVAGPGQPRA